MKFLLQLFVFVSLLAILVRDGLPINAANLVIFVAFTVAFALDLARRRGGHRDDDGIGAEP